MSGAGLLLPEELGNRCLMEVRHARHVGLADGVNASRVLALLEFEGL